MVLIVLKAVKQGAEASYIARKAEEVCSPKCAEEFRRFLIHNLDRIDDFEVSEFNEYDAFAFIEGKQSRFRKILGILGFRIFQDDTRNRLKDMLLNSLLNKQLIEISTAHSFQRVFKVKLAKK